MSKTLIFLFDGTANNAAASDDPSIDSFTNVYAINELIADTKGYQAGGELRERPQVTFYMPGVGTVFTVKRPARGPLSWLFGDRVRQQIFGDGLEQLILRAYVNLCANFTSGDTIVCLGFSRGAAAARIFTRLISDFGILLSNKLMLLDRAWNEFIEISMEKDDAIYFAKIAAMKQEISATFNGQVIFHPEEDVSIDFLGCFDTVLGSMDNSTIRHVHLRDLYPAYKVRNVAHIISMHETRRSYELKRFTLRSGGNANIREIWMPGVHSDIGGGYPEYLIGRISLLTMADLLESQGGVALDRDSYDKVVSSVKEKLALGPIYINKEPFVDERRPRNTSIYGTDELHPLHWFLVSRKVYWKGYALPVDYINRFEKNRERVDPLLAHNFESWIGQSINVAGTQS